MANIKSQVLEWDPIEYELAREANLDHILVNEGGFQNNYHDSGNWTSGVVGEGEQKGTKYGISTASYPHLDIKNLTINDSKQIYKRDFLASPETNYGKNRVAFKVMDMSVHMGAGNATAVVQKALNDLHGTDLLDIDGKMGSDPNKGTRLAITGAIEIFGEDTFIDYISKAQADYYEDTIAKDPINKEQYRKNWIGTRAPWTPAPR